MGAAMEPQARDFWPVDIGVVNFLTPSAILREQASLLGRKTKNLIEAEVVTGPHTDGSIMHQFYLVVPAMDYSYRLFSVNHGVELYPLDIYFGSGPGPFARAASEEEFIGQLKNLLSSEKTKKVIQSLLGQIQP
jgi:hypothetical protein